MSHDIQKDTGIINILSMMNYDLAIHVKEMVVRTIVKSIIFDHYNVKETLIENSKFQKDTKGRLEKIKGQSFAKDKFIKKLKGKDIGIEEPTDEFLEVFRYEDCCKKFVTDFLKYLKNPCPNPNKDNKADEEFSDDQIGLKKEFIVEGKTTALNAVFDKRKDKRKIDLPTVLEAVREQMVAEYLEETGEKEISSDDEAQKKIDGCIKVAEEFLLKMKKCIDAKDCKKNSRCEHIPKIEELLSTFFCTYLFTIDKGKTEDTLNLSYITPFGEDQSDEDIKKLYSFHSQDALEQLGIWKEDDLQKEIPLIPLNKDKTKANEETRKKMGIRGLEDSCFNSILFNTTEEDYDVDIQVGNMAGIQVIVKNEKDAKLGIVALYTPLINIFRWFEDEGFGNLEKKIDDLIRSDKEIGRRFRIFRQLVDELMKNTAKKEDLAKAEEWKILTRGISHEIKNALHPILLLGNILNKNIEIINRNSNKKVSEWNIEHYNAGIEYLKFLACAFGDDSSYDLLDNQNNASNGLKLLIKKSMYLGLFSSKVSWSKSWKEGFYLFLIDEKNKIIENNLSPCINFHDGNLTPNLKAKRIAEQLVFMASFSNCFKHFFHFWSEKEGAQNKLPLDGDFTEANKCFIKENLFISISADRLTIQNKGFYHDKDSDIQKNESVKVVGTTEALIHALGKNYWEIAEKPIEKSTKEDGIYAWYELVINFPKEFWENRHERKEKKEADKKCSVNPKKGKLIWFEDQISTRKTIQENICQNLNERLKEYEWEFNLEEDFYIQNWDINLQENLDSIKNEGSKQIWIIDILAERLRGNSVSPYEVNRCKLWVDMEYARLVNEDKQIEKIVKENGLKKDDFYLNMGVIIAAIATYNNIPFLIASNNFGSYQNLLIYFSTGKETVERKDILEFQKSNVLNKIFAGDKEENTFIDKIIKKIQRIYNEETSLKELTPNEWRLIRATDRRERECSEYSSIDGGKELEKFAKNTFAPWHMLGAPEESKTDDRYYSPENWYRYLFSKEAIEILTCCGYDLKSLAQWRDPDRWNHPAVWQLLQNKDYETKLLSECILNWIGQKRDKISILYKQPKLNAFGDYLWFNIFGMCDALDDLFNIADSANIRSVNIYRLGTNKLEKIASPSTRNGLLCSIYINDYTEGNRAYNQAFPGARNQTLDTDLDYEKDLPKFCRRIFKAGAKWIFYSGADGDLVNHHFLYPENSDFNVKRFFPDASIKDAFYGKIEPPPTFAFFISPEIAANPFRPLTGTFDINNNNHRASAAFIVKSEKEYKTLSEKDEIKMMNEVAEIILGEKNGEYNEEN